jgi:hypothetical protein
VDYVGSEVQPQVGNGDIMGDVDTPQSQDVRLDGAENDGRCERGAELGGAGGVLSIFQLLDSF